MNNDKTAFEEARAGEWQTAFSDDCTVFSLPPKPVGE